MQAIASSGKSPSAACVVCSAIVFSAIRTRGEHMHEAGVKTAVLGVSTTINMWRCSAPPRWPSVFLVKRWLSSHGEGGGVPRIGALTTVREVLRTHQQHARVMRAMDVSACWNTLGKLVQRRRTEQRWLREALRQRPVLQPLLDTTRRHLPRLQARPLANTVHGLAVVTSAHAGFAADVSMWDAVTTRAMTVLQQCNPQEVANIVYALGKVSYASPALLDAVATEAQTQLRDFKPQELSNLVWAYATLNYTSPALFDAVAKEVQSRLHEFSPQELANVVWAYARLGNAKPALLDAVAEEAQTQLRDFKPQELTNTVWAYATLGHASPALFDAVAKEAQARTLRDFTQQDLSNMLWAYATIHREAPALFDAVAKDAPARLHDFCTQSLANMLWAYATLGHETPELLEAVAEEVQTRVQDFNAHDIANTVWAYATLGHASPALFDAVANEAQAKLHDFNPQALANTVWAYAVADAPAAALFSDSNFTERCAAAESDFTIAGLYQLHQWQLWLEERSHPWPRLPAPLAKRCHDAFCAEEGAPSRLQRLVVQALDALELQPREEVRTPQGYSLDAVVTVEECDVAVEVDGPSHFLGRSRTPNGATMLKRRQLRAAGWRLLSVPHWEWRALEDDSVESQREYLTRRLQEALGSQPTPQGDRPASLPFACRKCSGRKEYRAKKCGEPCPGAPP